MESRKKQELSLGVKTLNQDISVSISAMVVDSFVIMTYLSNLPPPDPVCYISPNGEQALLGKDTVMAAPVTLCLHDNQYLR